jgi:flagellar biogenesis protein FliO
MLAVFTLVGFAVWAVGRLRSPARSTAPR